jgi:outer membrane protein TolC
MRLHVAALVAVLAAPVCLAVPLTLEEATRNAETANPRVVAAKLNAAALAERAEALSARRFGSVDLSGVYNNYESSRLVRPISSELFADSAQGFLQLPWDADQMHLGISVQVPLLDAGAFRDGTRVARLTAESVGAAASHTREEAWLAVRTVYRNALTLTHALRAAEAYTEALEQGARDAALRLRVGAAAKVDADKVRFALAGVRAELVNVRGQLHATEATLAALMGEERPVEGYQLEEILKPPDSEVATVGVRYDLDAARLLVDAAGRRVTMARKAFGPELVFYGLYQQHDAPSVDWMETHELSLIFRMPLFDFGSRRASLREAQSARAAVEEHLRGKELEAASQAVDALARCETARAQLDAGAAQRSLGAEVARVEKLRLDQGSGRVEDYLAAKVSELRGETAYWQALYALQNANDYAAFVRGREILHD